MSALFTIFAKQKTKLKQNFKGIFELNYSVIKFNPIQICWLKTW